MRVAAVFFFLTLFTCSASFAEVSLKDQSEKDQNSYDWPVYCGKCGKYHIVGPCPRK